jgi:hypothetical protein
VTLEGVGVVATGDREGDMLFVDFGEEESGDAGDLELRLLLVCGGFSLKTVGRKYERGTIIVADDKRHESNVADARGMVQMLLG